MARNSLKRRGCGSTPRRDRPSRPAPLGVAFDLDRLDLVALRDLVDHVHGPRPPCRTRCACRPARRGDVGDEELAAVGVRAGVGHRQHAALVAHAVVGLVLELVARTAGAGALRAAALDHEIGDHAVELQAVVEAALGEIDEIGDRQRRLFGDTARRGRAAVGFEMWRTGTWCSRLRQDGEMSVAGRFSRVIGGSGSRTRYNTRLPRQPSRRPGALSACPSNSSATSPSSPTSTMARPPSSTACSSSPARSTNARSPPSG